MAEATTTIPSVDEILLSLDGSYQTLAEKLDRLYDPLSDVPDEGGWTIRQLLSHMIGGWQRIPVHCAHLIANGGGDVPIDFHNPYWTQEYEGASVLVFAAAMHAAYHGARAFVLARTPEELAIPGNTPFGPTTVAEFAAFSAAGHLVQFHGPQFDAFLT